MITQCNKGSDLPSCKIYEKFNQENDNSGNFTDACDAIQEGLGHEGIFDLCIKLGNNLLNFCSHDEKSNPLDYNCEFIHFWLFDEIFNNSSLTDNTMHTGTISRFYYTWNNIMGSLECKRECEPMKNLFYSVPLDDLKLRKDMYIYIYNYKNFEKITSNENICNRFSTYFPSMNKKYDNYKTSCPDKSKKCFPDTKSLEEYNPEKLCQRFQCKTEAIFAKYFAVESVQSHPEEAGSPEGPGSHDTRDDGALTLVDEHETSTILTTVGPSLLGLFIISFISFKFTPISSWLNKLILKNRNTEEYMDDEARSEMLNDYFIHENREPREKGYGITYQSAENIGDYNI
ncbi:PIR Superfamily Protein [Plasmodium ovale wallikeri]|uniref:PIR Superfamily Protein n=1 Tax=Plasmodium ovale wallikeri TaxID=864142 RepID=A0A1A9ALT0_PLAOA|nr:PIR Superfamily Protein [Plasmodium ovale wallikeri]SBT57035.1 PIR Superfamily Protein [Plasmodium ovale wallikeri]